ncbi:LysM peptidoglycan-binding domain-containing protein [Paenibacillus sp. VCA1]|uniref:LysM peptidoglycan-binding domain-containing protein n=1 Tax=Paenibacillus sp. VCA1 TaxID=3039148 RepID=UPI002872316C|nr:LysM peptidoglycan-binding domain-containing protein [Paenibacillus sp. VCA1]MDR9857278.1 LysM peptidoglycan-binding domain-containing protein [Paenibacillus sp. VCA1]
MFDQSYGLRFDIYERIHLSEELPGIAELEEVELLPHIQVISQDEQVALRGHLMLTGLYRGDGEDDNGTQKLEHLIPVEITVPANRVSSLDEISVEIENFDVDLLSKRSMNITGVLSLRGIETAASEPASSWSADEFTVVHASEDPAEDPVLAAFLEEGETSAHEEEAREPYDAAAADDGETEAFAAEDTAAAEAAGSPSETETQPDNEPAAVQRIAEEEPPAEEAPAPAALHTDKESGERGGKGHVQSNVWHFEHEDESELLHPEKTAIQANEEPEKDLYLTSAEQEQPFEPSFPFSAFHQEPVPQEEAPEDEREPRVAFGSKKEQQSGEKEPIGFSSLLSSSRSLKDQEQQATPEEPKAEEAERESTGSDEIQWQNLFLGSSSEKNQFRKVRLCIVQREETLETIANRYQLTAREILLHNRLTDQTVEEGQILYIP